MDVFRLLPLAAACALVAIVSACGGNSSNTSEEAYKRDPVAACLERAGATDIKKSDPGDFSGKIAESGAVEGAVGTTKFALVFEPDSDSARSSETVYAGAQGGSWQKGVLLDVLLKRSKNVVLAYERAPTDNAANTVEGCIGGDAKIDPEIAEQFGR
jgi:hypothetical protein